MLFGLSICEIQGWIDLGSRELLERLWTGLVLSWFVTGLVITGRIIDLTIKQLRNIHGKK